MPVSEETAIQLFAGLGNPGKEYAETRHNSGFMLIEAFKKALPARAVSETVSFGKGLLETARFARKNILLYRPMTYMNLSGEAILGLMRSKDISPKEMLIAYDDLDIPLGKIRICVGGSSGGHNGIESVISKCESADFARIRIGIGRENMTESDRIDFVLSGFTPDEKKIFDISLLMAVSALKLVLSRGINKAMNDFNGLDYNKFLNKAQTEV